MIKGITVFGFPICYAWSENIGGKWLQRYGLLLESVMDANHEGTVVFAITVR